MSASVQVAAKIYVRWNVSDQSKSGLVVLNMSFVARDPELTFKIFSLLVEHS